MKERKKKKKGKKSGSDKLGILFDFEHDGKLHFFSHECYG
jgi:hypothetical protein